MTFSRPHHPPATTGEVPPVETTDCCVVGAGPAGMVLALLLARQGVGVVLLEARQDFEREYRGEGLQASTLEILDELGLLDRVLELPHARVPRWVVRIPSGAIPILEPGRVNARHPYLLYMPQAPLLELLAAEAARCPSFRLVRGARAEALLQEQGIVRGVRYQRGGRHHELRAALVVGADGRFSKVRQLAGLAAVRLATTMDVLWFRLPTRAGETPAQAGVYAAGGGAYGVAVYRGSEWQLGLAFPTGAYQQVRGRGLESVRRTVRALMPWLGDRVDGLQQWSQTALLAVEASRVRRWYRPGLLLIGDAAHVMSPAGAVGINAAVADAVAAARILGPALRRGEVRMRDLAAVQRRRAWHTRLAQWFQGTVEQEIWAAGRGPRMPLAARLVAASPALRALRNRVFVNSGLWPERVAPLDHPTPPTRRVRREPATVALG
jgi:2-polyprenyl-6-methoxyphenol hydroxylase-like FAD-dependent oxidoreductase